MSAHGAFARAHFVAVRPPAAALPAPGAAGGVRSKPGADCRGGAPAAGARASREMGVGRRGAAFARFEPVGVHRQAHRTTRLTPFETGVCENFIQAFLLCLRLHQAGARHHHGEFNALGHFPALHDTGGGAQIFDARIGAGADENLVESYTDRSIAENSWTRLPAAKALVRLSRYGFLFRIG